MSGCPQVLSVPGACGHVLSHRWPAAGSASTCISSGEVKAPPDKQCSVYLFPEGCRYGRAALPPRMMPVPQHGWEWLCQTPAQLHLLPSACPKQGINPEQAGCWKLIALRNPNPFCYSSARLAVVLTFSFLFCPFFSLDDGHEPGAGHQAGWWRTRESRRPQRGPLPRLCCLQGSSLLMCSSNIPPDCFVRQRGILGPQRG